MKIDTELYFEIKQSWQTGILFRSGFSSTSLQETCRLSDQFDTSIFLRHPTTHTRKFLEGMNGFCTPITSLLHIC